MGEGNVKVESSQGKSSGNVLGVFLSVIKCGKKGRQLQSEVRKGFGKYDNMTLRRVVLGTTNLHKVCCAHYRHLFSMLFIELFYRTQTSLSTYLYF